MRTNKVFYQYLESLMQENQGGMNWEVIEDDNVKKNIKHLFTQLLSIGYMIHKDDYIRCRRRNMKLFIYALQIGAIYDADIAVHPQEKKYLRKN